jgi:uncharacterized small protein (DUF1192 family)
MDDEPRARRPDVVLGEPLDTQSVADLEERIARLRQEIERTEAALAKKRASLDQAAGFFRR